MIKRTLYFGSPAYLSTTNQQLIVNYPDATNSSKSAAIEDVGIVILDHPQITISQPLISNLLHNNVALITCNERHLPQGLMLNLDGHHTQQAQLSAQIEATPSLKGRLWKSIIQYKILNQAGLLGQVGQSNDNMKYWSTQIKNDDPQNYEGRAAAYYWKTIFIDYIEGFIRGRFDAEPNALLNYGYAILRAIVARSLVGSGLHPSLGIHHHNKYNAYCLADDIMEPYRPYVDQLVLEIIESEKDWSELTSEIKSKLLILPTVDVIINKKCKPLMLAVQQTTASLAACYLKERKKLKLPEWLV